MSLWPAGNASAWGWTWEPYPGLWVAMLALVGGYVLLVRRFQSGRRAESTGSIGARRIALFTLAVGAMWIVLDWPIGALAAGYLLSAHTVQYLVICLVVGPLLLLALPPLATTPPRHIDGIAPRVPARASWARRLTHPVFTLAIFAAITLLSFWPSVVDALRPHALGGVWFAVVWLGAAILLWWPVIGPTPSLNRLPYLVGLGYLFLPFILPKAPGIIFAFTDSALYEVYATAPRALDLSPRTDQQIAGLMLWIVGSVMILVALGVLFFRWYDEDRRMSRPDSLAVPASPEAVEVLFATPGGWTALEQLIAIVDRALPERNTGAELAFVVREQRVRGAGRVATSRQVVLELRTALGPADEAALGERIARDFDAFVATFAADERAAIDERLTFRVIGYGSRVR